MNLKTIKELIKFLEEFGAVRYVSYIYTIQCTIKNTKLHQLEVCMENEGQFSTMGIMPYIIHSRSIEGAINNVVEFFSKNCTPIKK